MSGPLGYHQRAVRVGRTLSDPALTRLRSVLQRDPGGAMKITVGDEAPDFELPSHRGGMVRLSSFRGTKRVLIAFHPLAWTPV